MPSAQNVKAGGAHVELSVLDRTQKALRELEHRLSNISKTVGAVGTRFLAIGATINGALAGAAAVFSKTGDAIDKMSARTGLSAEMLSELGFAAQQSGTSLQAVEQASRGLDRVLTAAANGSAEAGNAIAEIGYSIEDLLRLNPDQRFTAIAQGLSQVQDEGLRAGLAMKLLGDSGTQLLPLIQGGAAGLSALRDEARRLGLTISQETAAKAAKLTDALGRMKSTTKDVVFEIGNAVAGPMTRFADMATTIIVGVADWVSRNHELVQTIALVGAAAVAAGTAIVGVALAIKVASLAAAAAASVLAAVQAVVAALSSPIILVGALVVGLAGAFLYFSGIGAKVIDSVSKHFGQFGGIVKDTIGGVVKALEAGDLEAASDVLMAGVEAAWISGVAALKQVWIDLKEDLATIFAQIANGAKVAFIIATREAAIAAAKLNPLFDDVEKGAVIAAAQGTASGLIKSALSDGAQEIRELLDKYDEQRDTLTTETEDKIEAAIAKLKGIIENIKTAGGGGGEELVYGPNGGDVPSGLDFGALSEERQKQFQDIIESAKGSLTESRGIFNIKALGSLAPDSRQRDYIDILKRSGAKIEDILRYVRKISEKRGGGIQLA